MSGVDKLDPKYSDWLFSDGLQHLFDVLEVEGEETRVNGGAVRNSLLGEPIGDVDLSTTLEPEAVMEILKAAGVKAIATGLLHGTVTAVIDRQPFEITTLRRDIETDGRHAKVEFGRDWEEDARRRDLTMNALYCDRKGRVYDPLSGYDDLMARNVRFIGNAADRIEEDNLRILRFFRFFAQYGNGRPDGDGLKACARLKSGIEQLSAERVWMELKKILSVGDPSRALLWMRTTGVLNVALPESENWGIDFVSDIIAAEGDLDWPVDAMSRLQVMVPPTVERMTELSKRLRLSGREKTRMLEWVKSDLPDGQIKFDALETLLYQNFPGGICDRLRCEIVRQRHIAVEKQDALIEAANYTKLLNHVLAWQRPAFPLKGRHLQETGILAGPKMGETLKRLETVWVESGFALQRDELLKLV